MEKATGRREAASPITRSTTTPGGRRRQQTRSRQDPLGPSLFLFNLTVEKREKSGVPSAGTLRSKRLTGGLKSTKYNLYS
ncbi:hypothetical protein AVEN_163703-1 [Araneus ventricosus]|uniref:Uncharacterized protein n=1 Tax=Araneus ventricosus TaxID=182803 RepID=A0A4Y2WX80_ARAVE|nr:hypothetical protein AVEN_127243-1 [Araneus ventricosus]GBO43076.1 hypothetical protein AVEN_163703-1 [Araneus ventricosus]